MNIYQFLSLLGVVACVSYGIAPDRQPVDPQKQRLGSHREQLNNSPLTDKVDTLRSRR